MEPLADAAQAWAPGLALAQSITLDQGLTQTLRTHNRGSAPLTR